MYEYLLTMSNSRGRRKTVIAEAATADEAIRRFEAKGASNIVLHTDELAAPFFKPSALVKQFRPEQIVYLRTTGPLAFSWVLAAGHSLTNSRTTSTGRWSEATDSAITEALATRKCPIGRKRT